MASVMEDIVMDPRQLDNEIRRLKEELAACQDARQTRTRIRRNCFFSVKPLEPNTRERVLKARIAHAEIVRFRQKTGLPMPSYQGLIG
jgi:hypothetical protein